MKTKETNPARPGSSTPCKQALSNSMNTKLRRMNYLLCIKSIPFTADELFITFPLNFPVISKENVNYKKWKEVWLKKKRIWLERKKNLMKQRSSSRKGQPLVLKQSKQSKPLFNCRQENATAFRSLRNTILIRLATLIKPHFL